jgi:hypothetical protein
MNEAPNTQAVEAPSEIVERAAGGDGPISARDAARSLIDARHKDGARERRDDDEARDGATPDTQSTPQGDDAARSTTDPGETAREGDQAEGPPIEPPRSWTKEDKELFKDLPRETQARLVDRERSREGDFLRRQQEAAEKLKGLGAQQQAVEQARAHYERALPQLVQTLHQQQAGEFADIQSIADVERLAREDWPRFNVWQAQQMKIAAVQRQIEDTEQRQSSEQATRWNTFAHQQDALFFEKAPELRDKDALAKSFATASQMLKDLGFEESELADLWHGKKSIAFRDHRIQLLLRDGVRFREAKAATKDAAIRPVPQVQRPGAARPRGADADERLKALGDKLNQSGTLKDAAALLAAQRQARR